MSEEKNNLAYNDSDNAIHRVPDNQRKGFISIAAVAAGFCICMSGLYTGAAIAFGLSFKNAIIAAVIGNVILSLYGGAIGDAGFVPGRRLYYIALCCSSLGRDTDDVHSILRV